MYQKFGAKREFWKKQIADWEKSGESGKQWVKRHNLSYQAFNYWKKRFHLSVKSGDFIELLEKKTPPMHICFKDVQIEVNEHFQPETLARVLLTIKKALC